MPFAFLQALLKYRSKNGRIHISPIFVRRKLQKKQFIFAQSQWHNGLKQPPIEIIHAFVLAKGRCAGRIHFPKQARNQVITQFGKIAFCGISVPTLIDKTGKNLVGQQVYIFGIHRQNALQTIAHRIFAGQLWARFHNRIENRRHFFGSTYRNFFFVLVKKGLFAIVFGKQK